MPEPIQISTKKYVRDGKVNVDGNIWHVRLPGSGTELRVNQAQRRLKVLDKKIEEGTVTEEDLDRYDTYERTLYDVFRGMFKDDTDDNSEVNAWIDETPLMLIVRAFEDIKAQSSGDTSGQQEPPAST